MGYVETNGSDGSKIRTYVEGKHRPSKTDWTVQPLLVESFQWMKGIGDFKSEPWGEKGVRIKGKALTSNCVSKNGRKYVEAELVKSARTLVGRPINVNHDDKNIVGHVDWAEFEDGAIEFLASIKKEPYPTLIRNHDKSLRGVSVQADYLKLQCSRCGKPFSNEKEWQDHMATVEYMKTAEMEPHGLNFKALSLVVSPQEPGVSSASFEIAESMNGELKLCETIINEKLVFVGVSGNAAKVPLTNPIMIQGVKDVALAEKYGLKVNKLGEPFAGYTDFADCVSKNSGKDDPEAYCAVAMRNVEGGSVSDVKVEKRISSTESSASPSSVGQAPTVPLDHVQRWKMAIEAFMVSVDRKPPENVLRFNEATMDYLHGVDQKHAEELFAKNLEIHDLTVEVGSLKINRLAETGPLEQKLAEALKIGETLQKRVIVLENENDKFESVFKGREKPLKKPDW